VGTAFVVCPECQIRVKGEASNFCMHCGKKMFDDEGSGSAITTEEDNTKSAELILHMLEDIRENGLANKGELRNTSIEATRIDPQSATAFALMAAIGESLTEAESAWKRALVLNNNREFSEPIADYLFVLAYDNLFNRSEADNQRRKFYLTRCSEWADLASGGENEELLKRCGLDLARYNALALEMMDTQPTPAQPQQASYQAPVCSACGRPLTFYPQNNSYYCEVCSGYTHLYTEPVVSEMVWVKNPTRGILMTLGGVFAALGAIFLILTCFGAIFGIPLFVLSMWMIAYGINETIGRPVFTVGAKPSFSVWLPGRPVVSQTRAFPPPPYGSQGQYPGQNQ